MPQNQQSGVKPASNTGLYSQNRFNQSIDWLNATGILDCHTVTDFKQLITELCDLFGQVHEWDCSQPFFCGQTYQEHAKTSLGIIAGIQTPIPEFDAPGRTLLIIPGKAWASVPKTTWLKVIKLIGDFGLKATRLDIAIDDHEKALTYDLIGDALKRGCARGVRKAPVITDELNPAAWTRYIGSRSSSKVVRIYNKAEQSKGEINSIRLEVEFKSNKSREAFNRLYTIATKIKDSTNLNDVIYFGLEPKLNDLATGSLDFREPKEGETNYSRRERCVWWQEFIDALESAPEVISIPTKKPALADKQHWVTKQVMKTLTLIRLAEGSKGFDKFIEDGIKEKRAKLTPYEKTLINQYHKDKYKATSQAA